MGPAGASVPLPERDLRARDETALAPLVVEAAGVGDRPPIGDGPETVIGQEVGAPAPGGLFRGGPDQEPPVVKVTIGRVEVRARFAPEKPKREARREPRMSLEDYLRSQNGGSR